MSRIVLKLESISGVSCLAIIIYAFIFGGILCMVGQLLMDLTPLTPAHILSTFVVIGAILGGIGWYEPLVKAVGAGALVPVFSFGNAIVKGALTEIREDGVIGLLAGIFKVTSAGISAAIIFSFFTAVFFKPHG
ncbi:MAG: stage sporulation protein [Bacillota bacterium]|jgi:stage V sporulation protein AE